VAVASSGFEGLDDVEYYRHGIEYGDEIDRQERQRDLEWTIAHNFDKAQTPSEAFPLRIALLNSDHKPIMHAKAKVKIGRPATLREDQTYELKEVGPGIYATDVNLGLGNWKIDVEVEKGDDLVKVEFRHSVSGGVPSNFPKEKAPAVGAELEVTPAVVTN
jgi:nitrogen fixation protein FixH